MLKSASLKFLHSRTKMKFTIAAIFATGLARAATAGLSKTFQPYFNILLMLSDLDMQTSGVANSQPAPAGCHWTGTAPFCNSQCPAGSAECFIDGCGDGACCTAGYKRLCCKQASQCPTEV